MGLIMLYYKNKEIEEKGEPQRWLDMLGTLDDMANNRKMA